MRARSRAWTEKSNQSAATRHRKNQKMSQQLSISAQMELKAAQDELLEISSRSKIGPAEKRRFDALLSRVSLLKSGAISDEVREKQAADLAREMGLPHVDFASEATRTKREDSENLRMYLAKGELRTYAGMQIETDSAGGYFVPHTFYKTVTAALKQMDGLWSDDVITLYEDT